MTRKLLAVYGLKWNPFTPEIPDDALWRTPEIDHFCWRVEHLVREGGFALVTGESGTGKSIALRLLARHLSGLPEVVVGVLTRPQSAVADCYRELGEIFGITLKVHYRWSSFKELRQKWEAHLAATLWRPVLLIDEAQEMEPEVLSELRLLSSTHFDSRPILTVVLSGDGRLSELLRLPKLIPLGTRIRARLPLDYATPKQLSELLTHLLAQAGNPRLMTPTLVATLCEHAAGNCRVLCNMAAELLAEGLRREVSQLDEKLYLEVFGASSRSRTRTDARRAAG
jgi:general secretion pathway protein A